MSLQHSKCAVRHIGQRSMGLLAGAHTGSTGGSNVPWNDLAAEYSIVGIHNRSTAVGYILILDNMTNELELGVVLTDDRHSSSHGRQICGREAECGARNIGNLDLVINRGAIDIRTCAPFYVVAGNSTVNLCGIENRDTSTCRIDCVVDNLCEGHCARIRHTGPDNLGAGDLCIRLLVSKLQASLYNGRILAQDNTVIASVLTIDEIHRLRISLYSIAGYCCKIHNSVPGRGTCGIHTLSERVIAVQALEDVIECLQHALTGAHRAKHIHML